MNTNLGGGREEVGSLAGGSHRNVSRKAWRAILFVLITMYSTEKRELGGRRAGVLSFFVPIRSKGQADEAHIEVSPEKPEERCRSEGANSP